MYDVEKIRQDFPILFRKVNGKPHAFLDSAASAQKPKCVIDKISSIFENQYANVHRGSYQFSEMITYEYEEARKIVQNFIKAKSENEIVFTRNATESINLVAATWGKKFLKKGDEILISVAEHHANLIPWQMLRDELGITLKFFNINDDGSFSKEEFEKSLSPKTKLVSVTAMSNVLGTIFPIEYIIKKAREVGATTLIDACQYIVHHPIDVSKLDCDFLVFSGHKLYAPTGIGILYGKYDILDSMPPYQTGGDMVDKVTFENTTFAAPPARFEAGTPAIVEAIALGEAIRYLEGIGMENILKHEVELTAYTTQKLSEIEGLKIIGTAKDKGGVFSFEVEGIHPQDLAFVLDKEGVSVRTGHHCAEPLVNLLGYTSLARASLGMYTTKADIDQLVAAINKAKTFF
jgi:cysteine desulfurase/selenocysteine lyase